MRAVIQRVTNAHVSVDNKIVGQIENGFLILLGIEEMDNGDDISWLIKKISGLRIFGDDQGKMNLSINDTKGNILVISQFTLFASTKKGNRPSFLRSAKPEIAIPLYESFCEKLEVGINGEVERGIFGAQMEVSLTNDGPVTIIIDTKNRE